MLIAAGLVAAALIPVAALQLVTATGRNRPIERVGLEVDRGRLMSLPLGFVRAPHSHTLVAQTGDLALAVMPGAARLSLGAGRARTSVTLQLVGAHTLPLATDRLPGKVNEYIGRRRSHWVVGGTSFSEVRERSAWPGISVVFHGNAKRLEYDFTLRADADPTEIRLAFGGQRRISIDRFGDLVLALRGDRRIVEPRPRAFQVVEGHLRPVTVAYALDRSDVDHGRDGGNERTVSLRLGTYKRRLPLLIDPSLEYGTYLGGQGGFSVEDSATSVAIDPTNQDILVAGHASTGFPQGATTTRDGDGDIYLARLNPTGTKLLTTTFVGGSDDVSQASGLAVDADGNAYVSGSTSASDFPTVSSSRAFAGSEDAFALKIAPSGALTYSILLGAADSNTTGAGIGVSSNENAYLTGATSATTGFPTTPGAYQSAYAGGSTDAYVASLTPAGSGFNYVTLLGSSEADAGTGIAVDSAGDAYVSGDTTCSNGESSPFPAVTQGGSPYDSTCTNTPGGSLGFVSEFSPTGELSYSTLDAEGTASAITIDSSGDAFVTGDFYTGDEPPAEAYVLELNPSGTGRVGYVKVVGAASQGTAIAVDPSGGTWITGSTPSDDLPTTDAFEPDITSDTNGTTGTHAFVAHLPAGGQSPYDMISYLGGTGSDAGLGLAPDAGSGGGGGGADGNVLIAGTTTSADFPVTSGAVQATSNANGQDTLGQGFLVEVGGDDGPTNSAQPEISGTAQPGQTLTASDGSFASGSQITYGYRWTLCNSTGNDCARSPGRTARSTC